MKFKKTRTLALDWLFFAHVLFITAGGAYSAWDEYKLGILSFPRMITEFSISSILFLIVIPLTIFGVKSFFDPAVSLGENSLIIPTGPRALRNKRIPYESIKKVDIDKTVYLHFKDDKQTDSGIYIHLRKKDFSNFKEELSKKSETIKIQDMR